MGFYFQAAAAAFSGISCFKKKKSLNAIALENLKTTNKMSACLCEHAHLKIEVSGDMLTCLCQRACAQPCLLDEITRTGQQ